LKKRFLRNNLNTTGESEDGSNYGLSHASRSIVSGDQKTVSKVGSKISSKKAYSKTDRQSFLNRNRSAYKSGN